MPASCEKWDRRERMFITVGIAPCYNFGHSQSGHLPATCAENVFRFPAPALLLPLYLHLFLLPILNAKEIIH